MPSDRPHPTRRRLLRSAAALACAGAVAGCGGTAESSGTAVSDPDPPDDAVTDPESVVLRAPPDRHVLRVGTDGTAADSDPQIDEWRHNLIANAETAASVSIADVNGADEARRLLEATDFDAETVYVERHVVGECFDQRLCWVQWTAERVETSYARSTLDATPAPFDEATIPNGVTRERLNDEYDGALRAIRDASEAPTPYERLDHAARARAGAHEVAAAWDAIQSALTAADLRESVPAVRDTVEAFARRRSYVGSDPVRTAVVHAAVDRRIRGTRNWASIPDREIGAAAGQSLELAEVAADLERARAAVAAGSYLFDRFRSSLADPVDRRDRLATARRQLRDRAESRADPVPAERVEDPTSLVDRDVDATAGVRALAALGSDARRRIEDGVTDDGGSTLATDTIHAVGTLTRVRAYRRLRDRIEGGDDVAVASAEDVAALRSDAVDAVKVARDADRARPVIVSILPHLADDVGYADGWFDRGSGGIRVELVAFDAMRYVTVAALCRALPETAAEAAAVLRGSG